MMRTDQLLRRSMVLHECRLASRVETFAVYKHDMAPVAQMSTNGP
jgi:hypothetical protein